MIYFPCSPPHGTHLRPFPEAIVPLWLRNFILDQSPIFPLAKLLHFFDIRKPAHIFWCIFPPHGPHLRPFPEILFWTNIPHSNSLPPSSVSRNFILDVLIFANFSFFIHEYLLISKYFCNFAASFVKWKTYIFIISVCYLSIVLECGSFKRRENSNSKCPCIYGRYLRFL